MITLWSILILTQAGREEYLNRLCAVLKPQIQAHSDIEINIRVSDPRTDLGSNRQEMIDAATGTYIGFIDDDDLIPANYVDRIYPLLDGVDYIGFTLQMFIDGDKQKPTFHSLRYTDWRSDDKGWYRDISHLNPIRRELALKVKMAGGFGEDARWADSLRATGLVKTEHYIDEVMYYYYYRSSKNDAVSSKELERNDVPPGVGNPFRVGHRRPICPVCKSTSCGIGGGLRICNQCGATWV